MDPVGSATISCHIGSISFCVSLRWVYTNPRLSMDTPDTPQFQVSPIIKTCELSVWLTAW